VALFFFDNRVKIFVESETLLLWEGTFPMKFGLGHLIVVSAIVLAIGGCVHAISRQNRELALQGLTPESILRGFDIYRGKLVLMGGEIIETKNLEHETLIEVLQRPLSRNTDRPLQDEDADGRFFVTYPNFMDPYIYAQGREITVAGIVTEKKVSKIGQKDYTYVVLENRETHLWPERVDYYEPYPYGSPYWYPYYPWWYYRPYYPRHYHH
jgi:outer membrane lipoprotein